MDVRLIFPTILSMMEHFHLDPAQFILGKTAYNYDYYDSPRVVKEVVNAAHTMFHEHRIVLAADELVGWRAPDMCDWTEVENGLPENSNLLLTFNPGMTRKILKLSSSPTFHHVVSELNYRNTLAIHELHTCVSQHMSQAKPVILPGKPATDVRGELPLIIDLGFSKASEEVRRALVAAREALGEGVTVMRDKNFLSPESMQVLKVTISQWTSWRMEEGDDFGWEWDKVVVVGRGDQEEISRARCMLVVIRVCQVEERKEVYDWYSPGFQEAKRSRLVQSLHI